MPKCIRKVNKQQNTVNITLIVDIWEVEISIEMVLFFKSNSLIQVKEKKLYYIYIDIVEFLPQASFSSA